MRRVLSPMSDALARLREAPPDMDLVASFDGEFIYCRLRREGVLVLDAQKLLLGTLGPELGDVVAAEGAPLPKATLARACAADVRLWRALCSATVAPFKAPDEWRRFCELLQAFVQGAEPVLWLRLMETLDAFEARWQPALYAYIFEEGSMYSQSSDSAAEGARIHDVAVVVLGVRCFEGAYVPCALMRAQGGRLEVPCAAIEPQQQMSAATEAVARAVAGDAFDSSWVTQTLVDAGLGMRITVAAAPSRWDPSPNGTWVSLKRITRAAKRYETVRVGERDMELGPRAAVIMRRGRKNISDAARRLR